MVQPKPISEILILRHQPTTQGDDVLSEPYHSPVDPLQYRLTVEAIVDARYEATGDQSNYSDIVELIAKARYLGRMIADKMIGCAHA